MTPGQLIDLLEKAEMLIEKSPGVFDWHPTMAKAERFAKLVAANEREACAKVCESLVKDRPDVIDVTSDLVASTCAHTIRALGDDDE